MQIIFAIAVFASINLLMMGKSKSAAALFISGSAFCFGYRYLVNGEELRSVFGSILFIVFISAFGCWAAKDAQRLVDGISKIDCK